MASPSGNRSRAPKKLGERQPLHSGLVLAQDPRKGLLRTGCAKPELPPGGRGSLRAVVAPPGMCFSPGWVLGGRGGAKVAGMPWAQLWVLAEQRALRTGYPQPAGESGVQ